IVIATSFGARLSRFAQRAASTSSAVESGPPETARMRPREFSRPENNAFASSSRRAWSAVGAFLFTVDALLHAERSARIFPQHLAKRGACGFFFAQGRKRLPQPQQRVRSARGVLVFGGNGEKGFRSVAVLFVLKQALAQPVLRFGSEPVARIFVQEIAERLLGEREVFV